ncbi:Ferredoxin subunit of nitrite reductase and ring-hydroxylating dioxygenase [Planctomycetales bacterium 10988]|nr:Ferredoxin subunit of nitrite reductase and ring-hydroxylating dioxygenase [Planctomycetales bacterium 10988]
MIKVAKVSEIPASGILPVEVEDQFLIIVHQDGEYFALEDQCSHAAVPLSDGNLEEGAIVCPMHGAKFDIRSGAALTMPAIRPIQSFPVKVEDDDIYIALDEEE